MIACLDQKGLLTFKARAETVSEPLSSVGPGGCTLSVCPSHFLIKYPKITHLCVFLLKKFPKLSKL